MSIKKLSLFALLSSFAFALFAADCLTLPNPQKKNYNRGNLYNLINGSAPSYLELGFKRLDYFVYDFPDGANIRVFQYNMGTPLAAYAIYSFESDPNAKKVDFVKQGYITENSDYYLRKGQYYIIVSVYNPKKEESLRQAAKQIAIKHSNKAKRENEDEGLEILNGVPKENLVETSLEYKPKDGLGLSFITKSVLAKYTYKKDKISLLVTKCSDNLNVEQTIKKYLEQIKSFDGKIEEIKIGDNRVYLCEDMGMFSFVFVRDSFLTIIYDVKNPEPVKAFIKNLYGQNSPEKKVETKQKEDPFNF